MAIDTDKMKALAAELRANHEAMKSWMPTHQLESSPASKGADAIDTLLAALESSKQEADALLSTIAECRDKAHAEGYGESFLYEAIACPDDVPAFIGQTVTELRAALEAREADRRRLSLELEGVIIDTEQGYGFDEVCLATVKRVRAALAQRQKGEEDERA
ncbi:hypothetical protein [Burkholderia multivorans]|uniref:hypothetical protein n=1 Tax=Burkholderia multivorans TaxID=87883 RepID=UPI0028702F48|nr:hypothetical protein [Burkholderia multivorans]